MNANENEIGTGRAAMEKMLPIGRDDANLLRFCDRYRYPVNVSESGRLYTNFFDVYVVGL